MLTEQAAAIGGLALDDISRESFGCDFNLGTPIGKLAFLSHITERFFGRPTSLGRTFSS
jgi:hypothetical protein